MLDLLEVLTLLALSWFTLYFSWPSPLLLPAILALLCAASSKSLAPDLASKTSVFTFVRSDPYNNKITITAVFFDKYCLQFDM